MDFKFYLSSSPLWLLTIDPFASRLACVFENLMVSFLYLSMMVLNHPWFNILCILASLIGARSHYMDFFGLLNHTLLVLFDINSNFYFRTNTSFIYNSFIICIYFYDLFIFSDFYCYFDALSWIFLMNFSYFVCFILPRYEYVRIFFLIKRSFDRHTIWWMNRVILLWNLLSHNHPLIILKIQFSRHESCSLYLSNFYHRIIRKFKCGFHRYIIFIIFLWFRREWWQTK